MYQPDAEIILYVANQQKSRDFYAAIFGRGPELDVPGMTEFALAPNLKLGLMPETSIARILQGKTPHPATGNGIPRCELYLQSADAEARFARALQAGAVAVSPYLLRDWGHYAAYAADADGHIIAFANKA